MRLNVSAGTTKGMRPAAAIKSEPHGFFVRWMRTCLFYLAATAFGFLCWRGAGFGLASSRISFFSSDSRKNDFLARGNKLLRLRAWDDYSWRF
jgi:hypothetical protein